MNINTIISILEVRIAAAAAAEKYNITKLCEQWNAEENTDIYHPETYMSPRTYASVYYYGHTLKEFGHEIGELCNFGMDAEFADEELYELFMCDDAESGERTYGLLNLTRIDREQKMGRPIKPQNFDFAADKIIGNFDDEEPEE